MFQLLFFISAECLATWRTGKFRKFENGPEKSRENQGLSKKGSKSGKSQGIL